MEFSGAPNFKWVFVRTLARVSNKCLEYVGFQGVALVPLLMLWKRKISFLNYPSTPSNMECKISVILPPQKNQNPQKTPTKNQTQTNNQKN